MGKCGILDLEKQFAFYGAYHSNRINIALHMIFVWPIGITLLLLLYFTPSPFPQISLFGNNLILVFNFGFLLALIYSVIYICLDPKSGSFTAFLVFFCWFGTSFLAARLGFSVSWKQESRYCYTKNCDGDYKQQVVLVAQLVCWTGQFIGHGVFEKRAPALLDNLVQAFIMAPFFVLLEGLQTLFGYEPYPGFHASVQAKIAAQISEWEEKKHKLIP